MLSFEDALKSVQLRAESEIAALADSMGAAVRDEQAARNKRQRFVSDAAADAGMGAVPVLLSLFVQHHIVHTDFNETTASYAGVHDGNKSSGQECDSMTGCHAVDKCIHVGYRIPFQIPFNASLVYSEIASLFCCRICNN